VIFVTVGAQMPFDRLVRTVDSWAATHLHHDVFAQIGTDGWRPPHVRWTEALSPAEFRRFAHDAGFIVAHAGMGTILTALEFGRPLLVMPRRGDLHETRNDHQVATGRRFAERGLVKVALDETELIHQLEEMHNFAAPSPLPPRASDELINALRAFIDGDVAAGRRTGRM
jgi:UDP-N-acetylglucosamine transferase subunit ALG13